MNLLKKGIDLLLYSNIYIGLCAVALTLETHILLGLPLQFSPVLVLVFCATLVIYALHRIIGISKVHEFIEEERYKVITQYKHHIWVYAGFAVLGGGIAFIYLPFAVQLALVLPGLISLGYVLPVFRGRKFRLRDYNLIKIYLVAIVWGFVTVFLPMAEYQLFADHRSWLLLLERMLFIFAITLPFDIRDLTVDQHNSVRTIPSSVGVQKSIFLAIALLVLGWCICFFILDGWRLIGVSVSYLLTVLLVWNSKHWKHDYWFTGLLDGTMLIRLATVWVFMWWMGDL